MITGLHFNMIPALQPSAHTPAYRPAVHPLLSYVNHFILQLLFTMQTLKPNYYRPSVLLSAAVPLCVSVVYPQRAAR